MDIIPIRVRKVNEQNKNILLFFANQAHPAALFVAFGYGKTVFPKRRLHFRFAGVNNTRGNKHRVLAHKPPDVFRKQHNHIRYDIGNHYVVNSVYFIGKVALQYAVLRFCKAIQLSVFNRCFDSTPRRAPTH